MSEDNYLLTGLEGPIEYPSLEKFSEYWCICDTNSYAANYCSARYDNNDYDIIRDKLKTRKLITTIYLFQIIYFFQVMYLR